jgi:NAD(P)-dependent dehydrogenase (short-subunit alcohol dehydrogenase family)
MSFPTRTEPWQAPTDPLQAQEAVMAFETTTAEVIAGINLEGNIAVVTGATTGLGRETARALASAGAHVIVCGRSAEKGEESAAAIRESVPSASLEIQPFDLADLGTVRAGAAAILERHDAINILVNNAGVMFTPEGRTADGFETQFGTNHVGHFLLTNLLMPALLAGSPARIVNVSSAGHGFGDVRWDDANFDDAPYDKFEAYGQSKTANILFTLELDRRFAEAGLRSNAVHPGMIMTDLARHMGGDDMEELGRRAAARAEAGTGGGLPKFKTIEQGAATSIYCAVSPDMEGVGGRYLDNVEFAEPAPYAADLEAAARLWAMSETLVGESFS